LRVPFWSQAGDFFTHEHDLEKKWTPQHFLAGSPLNHGAPQAQNTSPL
jgi:hypothetical protein